MNAFCWTDFNFQLTRNVACFTRRGSSAQRRIIRWNQVLFHFVGLQEVSVAENLIALLTVSLLHEQPISNIPYWLSCRDWDRCWTVGLLQSSPKGIIFDQLPNKVTTLKLFFSLSSRRTHKLVSVLSSRKTRNRGRLRTCGYPFRGGRIICTAPSPHFALLTRL